MLLLCFIACSHLWLCISVSSQALTCTVKGIVVLLKSHVGNSTLTLPAHGGALEKDFTSEDHCVYIHTEHSPFWDPKQEAHSLFVRQEIFIYYIKCKTSQAPVLTI